MGEHLIKVENLTLSYENMTVVKDLSFTVESGDYLCIVGENGSGKSTLVKSLLSLKKPVGGEITFGGGLRRNEIGYLPQQTGAQHDFPASVGEVVISGCLNSMGFRPFYTDRERKKAAENMERLSISDLKKRSFRELSGGQQQRVLLARALCATSKLLLLDEPGVRAGPDGHGGDVRAYRGHKPQRSYSRHGNSRCQRGSEIRGAYPMHAAGSYPGELVFRHTRGVPYEQCLGFSERGRGQWVTLFPRFSVRRYFSGRWW